MARMHVWLGPQESQLTGARAARRRRLARSLGAFLEALEKGDTVVAAAKASGRKGTRALYRFRAKYQQFAELWDAAIDVGTEYLEQVAVERARDGVEEPVYSGGREVGKRRRYSDGLLLRLLAARNPAKWGIHPSGEASASVTASLAGVEVTLEVEFVQDFQIGG